MKRVATILVLSLAAALVFAAVAYATEGDSTYLTWSGGGSPHGGYDINTKKCAVCHAVHHAGETGDGVGSEVLLRTTRADACTYCHITPGVSTKIVYDGVSANYSGSDFNTAHNSVAGASCTGCHQVHAAANAMTQNASLTVNILKNVTTSTLSGDATAAPLAGDTYDTALAKWCSLCHGYYNRAANGASHVMTTTLSTVAFSGSQYCTSCHASNTLGGVVPTGSAFPHYTDGARFLTSSVTSAGGTASTTKTTDPSADGVCLKCHRSGTGSGVGIMF